MNRLFLLSSVIFALSALTCSTASAQKHRKQVKKVQPVVVEPTEEEIAFENLLPAQEITFAAHRVDGTALHDEESI